jgi:redox-sensitive bicupin YhaK (pirin superfamily)
MSAQLLKIIPSQGTSDGAGVKLSRVAMFDEPLTDPFLMLDEFASSNESDYIAGFPAHPHRGMETLSYLLHGSLEHQDHVGNKGMIHSGGAQWMSAGRGIIHSEMPARELDKLQGFQLWINLPAEQKMLPELHLEGVKVRAIAGSWQIAGQQLQGPLQDLAAEAGYLDIHLDAGASLTLNTRTDQRVLVKQYQGVIDTSPQAPEKALLVFSQADELTLSSRNGARMIVLMGTPIKEKIVHYGPFVMNSHAEIEQAIHDYKSGRFGE